VETRGWPGFNCEGTITQFSLGKLNRLPQASPGGNNESILMAMEKPAQCVRAFPVTTQEIARLGMTNFSIVLVGPGPLHLPNRAATL
jgi:hypothetical protein